MYNIKQSDMISLPQIQNKKTNISNGDQVKTFLMKNFLHKVKQKKKELVLKLQKSQQDLQQNTISEQQDIKKRIKTQIPFYAKIRKPNRVNKFQQQFIKTNHRKNKTQISVTNQISQKSVNLNGKQKLSTHNLNSQLQERQNEMQKIQEIFHKIPKQQRRRNQFNTEQIRKYLKNYNIFFIKLNQIVVSCFIKLSKFISISKNKIIYKINSNPDAFYIILGGKVKLTNHDKGFKKICVPGEIFSQQLLYQQPQKKMCLQSARTYTKNYKIMCEQMLKFGYKSQYTEMQSLIKRNYISKNFLRKNNILPCYRIKK